MTHVIKQYLTRLGRKYTLGFYRKGRFCDFPFAFLKTKPLSKRKLFIKATLITKGSKNMFDRTIIPASVSVPFDWQKPSRYDTVVSTTPISLKQSCYKIAEKL